MFGYVTINKPELKVKDYERYHAYYCGLCRRLKERHGRFGQMTLTYDMTFLIILLTSLYEDKLETQKHTCIVHPHKKHLMLMNDVTNYGADMNIALSYHHFLDDWEDEKKMSGLLGKSAFSRRYKKIKKQYPTQCTAIEQALQGLASCEKENQLDPLAVSEWFGHLMAELMIFREDAFAGTLREIGDSLGRFIYLMDAYMDLDHDRKKGCYNPFLAWCDEDDYEEMVKQLLIQQIGRTTVALEKLPLELDVCLLRNILYEGVWTKYERKQMNDK